MFWNLCSPEYTHKKIELNPIGIVSEIQMDVLKVPRIFKISQKISKLGIVIHLSVAESMIRRNIVGVDLIPITVNKK